MLNNRNLEDRTYEELMAEAMMEIPLYTREWTNLNPSDPGVTILENLTAFEILQQNHINQITPAIQQKLLKLVGFEAAKGRCARVLLAAENLHEPVALPANQKFWLGDLCFETGRSLELGPWHLTGVWGMRDGKAQDYSHLLDWEVRVSERVFGPNPKPGDSLWLTMDRLPPAGEEVIFYMTETDGIRRNPAAERESGMFADLRWECYTEQGFVEMNVRDSTGGLVTSGEIRMRLPKEAAVPCETAPNGGYVIRAVLARADYDVPPALVEISGFLFEVWQKDTRSACHTFNRVSGAELRGNLLQDGYVTVFCKEKKGSSYKKYTEYPGLEPRGRYYEMRTEPDGSVSWQFDKRRFGYGPEKLKNAIKIATYSEEIMHQYALGTVLGSDHQEIRLPAGHVVPDSFCIIARRLDEDGEEIYDFVRPNKYGEGNLTYLLYDNEGRIVIEDAGDFIGAGLYMGTFGISRGSQGNIRAGNQLKAEGLPGSIRFYNPKPGTGGCYRETLDEVKARFLKDLKKPYTAVTASDYETLVKETPELCIDKVRAFLNESRNMVRIAVKPGTGEAFPKLPECYRKAIEKQLEDRRLLTTRIEIVPPAYVAVDVRGTVYVKRQYENSKAMIEAAIRRKIDDIHSEKNFGDVLKFDEVFHEIESLDCVEFVYELSLHPQTPGLAKLVDADVVPGDNCLFYAGNIELETGTYERR